MKNKCNKTVSVDEPYEIYVNDMAGFEWRVLKKYQNEENEAKNPYARWYCAVKSPYTYDSWEYGDVYAQDVVKYGERVK